MTMRNFHLESWEARACKENDDNALLWKKHWMLCGVLFAQYASFPFIINLETLRETFSFLCECNILHFPHNGSIPKRQCALANAKQGRTSAVCAWISRRSIKLCMRTSIDFPPRLQWRTELHSGGHTTRTSQSCLGHAKLCCYVVT